MRKEPQIGIEPMTARRGNIAPEGSSLSDKSKRLRESAQDAPESRPNRRKSGNEVAIGKRTRLSMSTAIYLLERAVVGALATACLAPVRGWE